MSRLALALLVALLVLTGCAEAPPEDEILGVGGSTPRQVVEAFLEDLNEALAAPLANPEVRRSWAERLAGHFAPSERADQRAALATMLADAAASTASPAVGSKATLEVSFARTEVIEQGDGEALVRVVDGLITLRFLDESGEVLRERTGGLTELLGQTSGGLPTLQVGGSWFLTEG